MSILFNSDLLKANTSHGIDSGSNGRKGPRKKSRRKRVENDLVSLGSAKYQDIVMYGFRCQLFIDDAARQDVEEGKLLIPWMGDKKLMIDRYDCRGSLYSKEEFDPTLSKTSTTLTPEEWQIEQDCDQERYRALHEDDVDLAHLEEEEEKRLTSYSNVDNDYKQVGFSYGDSTDGNTTSLLQEYYDYHRGAGHNDGESELSGGDFNRQHSYRGDEQYEPEMAAEDIDEEDAESDYDKTPEYFAVDSSPPSSYQETKPQYALFQPPKGLDIPAGMETPDTEKHHAIIEKTAAFLSKQSGQMEIILKARQSGNPQFAFLEFGNWLNPYYKFVLNAIKTGAYVPETSTLTTKTKSSPKESCKEQSGSDDSSDEYELHPSLKLSSAPVKTEAQPTYHYSTVVSRRSVRPVSKNLVATTEDVMKAYMATKYSAATDIEEMDEKDIDTSTKEVNDNAASYSASSERAQATGTDYKTSNTLTNSYNPYTWQNSEQSWHSWIEEAARSYGCDPVQYQTYLATLGYFPPPPPPEEEPQERKKNEAPPPPPPPGVEDDEDNYEDLKDSHEDEKEARSPGGSTDTEGENSTHEESLEERPDLSEDAPTEKEKEPTVIPPPPDLKLVVDKLALYVGKNGDEFEEGIKRKNDPRFDFLNPDHVYHPYYILRKAQHKEEQEQAKEKEKLEAEAKLSKPVAFMLKKKTQEKTQSKPTVTAVFCGDDEENGEEVGLEGYKPNIPIAEARVEEYKASKSQNRRGNVNRTVESSSKGQVANDEAKLMREKQMQQERRRRAAAFIGKLKQQQQEMSSAASAKESSKSSSSDDAKIRRHFREKRYIPNDEDHDPKKQRVTEEMLEKFKAIKEKIMNKERANEKSTE